MPITTYFKECPNCNTSYKTTNKRKVYCTSECCTQHRVNMKYKHYIEHQEDYCRSNKSMKFIKRHLLVEQKSGCDICGMSTLWNGKPIVFIMDHIDGDASNNMRDNLRLICPNCDSQLPTYKSKNKGSARKDRYLKNYKN